MYMIYLPSLKHMSMPHPIVQNAQMSYPNSSAKARSLSLVYSQLGHPAYLASDHHSSSLELLTLTYAGYPAPRGGLKSCRFNLRPMYPGTLAIIDHVHVDLGVDDLDYLLDCRRSCRSHLELEVLTFLLAPLKATRRDIKITFPL